MILQKNNLLEKAITSFKPIPFYFLNDDIDREEIVRQLDCMRDNGINAFFLHVRDGIINQAFGTDLFFSNVKFIVEQCAERGIKCWLYDEDAYPSGNCGGLTVVAHPELIAKSIVIAKPARDKDGVYRLNIGGNCIGVCGYIITKDNDGKEQARRVDSCFGSVRKTWYKRMLDKHYFSDMQDLRFKHIRGATCYAEVLFELEAPADAEVFCVYLKPCFTDNRYGTHADCLNRRTADFFINTVHKKYEEYVGEYFGTVIPGIFMDEPGLAATPYSDELEDFFFERFGYSLKDNYYKLSSLYTGESAAFRRDYFKAVADLFNKNFLLPLKEWCDRNGLIFTGHFAGEEALDIQSHGIDIYRATGYMDFPGIDLIGNDVGDLAHISLILGTKVVSSAAWQAGKDHIMCEAFALNPHNFGYQGMKMNADWLFAGGVNLLVPHGFFYGYSAFRRGDAGKSFFFQDPLFDEYKRFATYAENVGNVLHKYRASNKLLVVLPLSACSEEMLTYHQNSPATLSDRAKAITEKIHSVSRVLCSNHVDWDISFTESALQAKIEKGGMVLGERVYKEVIIIDGGEREKELYKRIDGKVEKVTYCSFPNTLSVTDQTVEGIEGDARHLLVLKKYSEEGNLYFIYNNNKDYVRFSLKDEDKFTVYDAEKNVYLALDKTKELALNGYQSIILVTNKVKALDRYLAPDKQEVVLEHKLNPQLIYKPVGAKLAITCFDLTVTAGESQKEYKDVGFVRLRDIVGTDDRIYKSAYMVPYFDTAPRITAPYPVYARYTTKLANVGGGILFDKDTLTGDYKIYFNGKQITEYKQKRVYDASNLIFFPEWKEGENVMEIVYEQGEEFDGINGELFVMQEDI